MKKELQGINNKMNILVLGNSGAGKTTLIKAISGQEIETSVGEGRKPNKNLIILKFSCS